MRLPENMQAMVTMGHGDIDQLVFQPDWPVPMPKGDEVLIKVGACGLNNTDVNTRTGWYSKAVSAATTGASYARVAEEDPTWGGVPISFPRIQGADVCGEIVVVGDGVDPARIGERVITDNWLRDPKDPTNIDKIDILDLSGMEDLRNIPQSPRPTPWRSIHPLAMRNWRPFPVPIPPQKAC